jgi:hypothetical protein
LPVRPDLLDDAHGCLALAMSLTSFRSLFFRTNAPIKCLATRVTFFKSFLTQCPVISESLLIACVKVFD